MDKKITITFVDKYKEKIGTFIMNGTLNNNYTTETGGVYLQKYNDTEKNNIKLQIEINW